MSGIFKNEETYEVFSMIFTDYKLSKIAFGVNTYADFISKAKDMIDLADIFFNPKLDIKILDELIYYTDDLTSF